MRSAARAASGSQRARCRLCFPVTPPPPGYRDPRPYSCPLLPLCPSSQRRACCGRESPSVGVVLRCPSRGVVCVACFVCAPCRPLCNCVRSGRPWRRIGYRRVLARRDDRQRPWTAFLLKPPVLPLRRRLMKKGPSPRLTTIALKKEQRPPTAKQKPSSDKRRKKTCANCVSLCRACCSFTLPRCVAFEHT